MNVFLCMIILLLFIICVLQAKASRIQQQQIQYLAEKIELIIAEKRQEKIMIFTENKELQALCVSINHLLDENCENKIAYDHTRRSMMRMLSNISHDLKTPLTTLAGYVEMLHYQYAQEPLIEKAGFKITEVINLINRFFVLVKLEAGDKILTIKSENLCEICRQNLFEFYDRLSQNQFEVEIQIPEKPIYCLVEKETIDRILKNLIENVIRYGKDGKYLGIKLKETKQEIQLSIEDHGKGIPEIYKQDVFERLFTLEDSRNKHYQGSGLGLAIVKELVKHMNGTITLESIPYKKTIFSIHFPIKCKKKVRF